MAPAQYTRVVLAERPKENIIPDKTFKREVVPYKFSPGEGEAVIKTEYLSLDPAMRGWLNDARSYIPPVKIGEVMRAVGLGKVVEVGKNANFKVGDAVRGVFGECRCLRLWLLVLKLQIKVGLNML